MPLDQERYQQWELIGEGGSANVFKAKDTELDIHVAIKLLNEKHRHNASTVESLREEVKHSRNLRHESICPIHDLYDGERGVGIVMDLIDGVELRDWMDENTHNIVETLDDRLTLLMKIAEALVIAHEQIIHRDLKPQNIFLRFKEGSQEPDLRQPILMDFGIAALKTEDNIDDGSGTPKYMAPEQGYLLLKYIAEQMGEVYTGPEPEIDHHVDIFAFGIIAYELLSAQIPPTSLANIVQSRHVPHVSRSEIPLPCHLFSEDVKINQYLLNDLIIDCMESEVDNRPHSATVVVNRLKKIIDSEGYVE